MKLILLTSFFTFFKKINLYNLTNFIYFSIQAQLKNYLFSNRVLIKIIVNNFNS